MIDNQGTKRRDSSRTPRRPQGDGRGARPPGRLRFRPEILDLEDRKLLSTFTVTNPSDTLTGGVATVGTLRWAVGQADAATTPSTIAFNLGSSPATITLTQGDLELTNVLDPVTIDGPGSGLLSVSGDDASRIFKFDNGVEASISGLEMRNGSMSLGGAIYNAGDLNLSGCLFLNNTAPPLYYTFGYTSEVGPGSGGAIFNNNGALNLADCTLTGNNANFGGAISGQTFGGVSAISLTDCTLTGNIADVYHGEFGTQSPGGGAIQLGDISGLTILSLVDCTLTGNATTGDAGGYGGAVAIYNSSYGKPVSDVSLTGCTIAGNSSADQTGGLSLAGNVTLTDCTIAGNTGTDGAGVQISGDSTLDLVACTISGNTSPNGQVGGLDVFSVTPYSYYGTSTPYTPQVTLTDTIIAGNTGVGGAADDVGGNAPYTLSGTNNLIGTGDTTGLSPSRNLLGVNNPGLAPLGDYGGPTETMPLQPGSPATGAGVSVPGLHTDQRGFALTGPVNIGAFQEAPGPLVVNTAIDGVGSPLGDLSLRQAVSLADVLDESSTIAFDARTFARPTTITLTSGQLELSNTAAPITIDGPGASSLAIDGNHESRGFQIDPDVTASISGLTITQGSVGTSGGGYGITQDGGGLYNQGSLTLTAVTVSDNVAQGFGGGIANSPSSSASITMTGCSITGNLAGLAGGLANGNENVASSGIVTLTGCTITGNTDYANCGGLLNCATATLTDCSVSGNTCKSGNTGGIYFLQGNTLTLTDCFVDDNFGGGISARFSNTLTLTGCSVNDNSYSSGVTTLDTGETITGCTISGNTGSFGGGLVVGGPATITGCTISGNTGILYSGGVFVEAYSPTTITGCTISGNTVLDRGATGGGLEVQSAGVATISGCTISGNSAPNGNGGGVGIDGLATLTGCTISGNSAPAGGGVFNYGTAALVACTVSGNSSPQGGGIDNYSSPIYTSRMTLTDTIVAGNTTGIGGAASDIGGTDPGDVTGTYNLIGVGGSGGLGPSSNLLNVANPGLAPLGFYGGTTQTMPLLPGSPAIDAGSNALAVDASGDPLTIDQRGLPRVVNGTVDIGAFETSGFIITPVPAFQITGPGQAFTSPLTFRVMPIHPGDPVAGGVVTLTAPASGASATLSAGSVVINSSGVGSVTAIANNVQGSYVVVTAAAGARVNSPYGAPGFELSNALAVAQRFQLDWGAHGSSNIYLQSDGLRDLPIGRSVDIPWMGIRSFTLTFSYPFTLLAGQVSVKGITAGDYGPVTVTGSGATYTITLARPINAADRVTLVIQNPDLIPYTRELDVLPGDVNDDGVVNAQDVAEARDLYLNIPIPNLPAATFGDILGDGSVDLADYNAVRSRVNTTLPPRP